MVRLVYIYTHVCCHIVPITDHLVVFLGYMYITLYITPPTPGVGKSLGENPLGEGLKNRFPEPGAWKGEAVLPDHEVVVNTYPGYASWIRMQIRDTY